MQIDWNRNWGTLIDCMLINREWYVPLQVWENLCRIWATLPIKKRFSIMTKRQDAVGIDTYLEAVGEQADVQ